MVSFAGREDKIFEAVSEMYTDVAENPKNPFHFPVGRPACEFIGYPKEQLDAIPPTALESFAGVGYPFAVGAIREGHRVLDIGSGSGTDVLIASNLTGPKGRVIGLDFTQAMLEKARGNAAKMGASNTEFVEGNAEEIPLPDDSVDAVTSNGVLNLVPDKARAFSEIFRVLRPGGRFQIADIVLTNPIKESSRENPQLWAECIVGAILDQEFTELFRRAGFEDLKVIAELDYFAKSTDEETREVAAKYGAKSLVVTGTKAPS